MRIGEVSAKLKFGAVCRRQQSSLNRVLFDHTSHGQTSSEEDIIRQLKELQVKNKKTIEKIIKDQNSTLRINPTTVQNLT